ncbi:hypothetical protein L798_11531 [Zootermopsis nevadensis]|uniref:Uncharacterized protein n=1 Tax=Zootermopsis nevadensis TaxID=136037 RepID=A0A067QZ30_ZOONE|nr:hypothetical protein L798_11531 [Zootermopsis nevadensis]
MFVLLLRLFVFIAEISATAVIFGHRMKSSISQKRRKLYRVSQEERSLLWEVIVSVILSKKFYMDMCPIRNGFRDSGLDLDVIAFINEHHDALRRATSYVLARVAKSIHVDGGILENVLY